MEEKAGAESGLIPGGARVVNSRLRARFTEAAWVSEQMGGLENLFFLREGLNFSIHAALPSLRQPDTGGWALSPDAHGQLLVDLLERYLPDVSRLRISTNSSTKRW